MGITQIEAQALIDSIKHWEKDAIEVFEAKPWDPVFHMDCNSCPLCRLTPTCKFCILSRYTLISCTEDDSPYVKFITNNTIESANNVIDWLWSILKLAYSRIPLEVKDIPVTDFDEESNKHIYIKRRKSKIKHWLGGKII